MGNSSGEKLGPARGIGIALLLSGTFWGLLYMAVNGF